MAALGLIERVVVDITGAVQTGKSVLVMKRAALATSGSGASPLTITVNHPGGIVASDTVEIFNKDATTQVSSSSGTSQFTCDSITDTTVVLSGFGGTLTITDDDIIIPLVSGSNPTVYEDEQGTETKAAANAALTTDADGRAFGYVQGGTYSIKISGTGITTEVVHGIGVFGENARSDETDTSSAIGWILDTLRSITTAGAKLLSLRTGGSEKFSVDRLGGFTAAQASTITAGGLTITAGGITVTAGGATITAGGVDINGGGLTVSGGATVEDTGLTVAAGGLTVSAGGATITGDTAITGDLKSTQRVTFSKTTTIASAATIDLAGDDFFVKITGTTNIATINIDGSSPGASDDGRMIILYNANGGGGGAFSITETGNIVTAGTSTSVTAEQGTWIRWDNATSKWINIREP